MKLGLENLTCIYDLVHGKLTNSSSERVLLVTGELPLWLRQ